MPSLVYALDISISMDKIYSNFKPSKLQASINSVAISARRAIIEEGLKTGLVVFAEWAVPLVYPTRNISHFLSALRLLGRTFLGSAPGDAVVEAVKVMRALHDHKKVVAVITDGDYNMGVPLEYALSYAKQSGVDLYIFVIGQIEETQLAGPYHQYKDIAHWVEVGSYEDLTSGLVKLVGGVSR
ncbi:MAG: VWA domain-containing protein [Desulfurococcales archaeon]|nr:VWA domain-containing protein [Desulfurococcales archaeon]